MSGRCARPAERSTRIVIAALAASVPSLPAAAQDTQLSVSAQAQGGYATNPFLIRGDDTGSAYVDLSIRPQVVQSDELGQVSASASYNRTEYLRRFDGTDSYGAEASGQRKLSELITGRANVAYYSSILGQGGLGIPTVVDPTLPPGPALPDVTVLGLRRRQELLTAGLGAGWQFSPRDSGATDISMSRVDYGGGDDLLTSSRSISATASYTRTLSSRTSVGLRGSGSWTEFGRSGYNGAYYSAELTYQRQLNETMKLDLAAGLLFIRSDTNLGQTNSTGFSGSATLCDTRQRQTLCVRAYSSAQPTGFGDVSKSYGGSVNYSYRINEDDFIVAGVDFSQVDTTASLIQIPSSKYFNANGSYEHNFSNRLVGGLGAGYRRTAGGFFGHEDDLNLRAYVRIRLGDVQ